MEWRMVLRRRMVVFVLLAILFLDAFFFMQGLSSWRTEVQYMREDEMMSSDAEDEDASASYHDKIQTILTNAENMQAISIFSNAESFTGRNISRTIHDYKGLLSLELPDGDYSDYEYLFSCRETTWLTLLIVIFIVLMVYHEENAGIRCVIHASLRGRAYRTLHRASGILLWSLGAGAVIWLIPVFCLLFTGAPGMLAPVQAVPSMQSCTLRVSILGMTVLCMLCTAFISWLLGTAVMFLADISGHMVLSICFVSVLMALGFFLYSAVSADSTFNMLHYINVFYAMRPGDMFSEYRNLNWFGYPVSQSTLLLLVELLLMCALLTADALTAGSRYPVRSGNVRLAVRIRLRAPSSPAAAEWWKLLANGKGLLLIALLVAVLIGQTDLTPAAVSRKQSLYASFMKEYEGPPDQESGAEIAKRQKKIDEVTAKRKAAEESYAKGEIDEETYFGVQLYYDDYEAEREALQMIQNQTERLESLKERGISGWYVNQYCYNALFGRNYIYGSMIAVIVILCLAGGIFSSEHGSGMEPVIRAAARGRKPFFAGKVRTAVLFAFAVAGAQTLCELTENAVVYGFSGLGAPVQSLSQLDFVGIHCTILQLLILLYALRLLMMASLGLIAAGIDELWGMRAVTIALLIAAVPEVLIALGFPMFRYISVPEYLLVLPLVAKTQSLVPLLAFAAALVLAGILVTAAAAGKWNYNLITVSKV